MTYDVIVHYWSSDDADAAAASDTSDSHNNLRDALNTAVSRIVALDAMGFELRAAEPSRFMAADKIPLQWEGSMQNAMGGDEEVYVTVMRRN